MAIKYDGELTSDVIVTLPRAVAYNSDLLIDLSIVLASRYYWDIQGRKLYIRLKKRTKELQTKKCDDLNTSHQLLMLKVQYKTFRKIKKHLKFFDNKTEQEIINMPFNKKDESSYNKHIKGLFKLRKIMWV